MVVPHTLSQGKFIILSLMSLSSSKQSRWGENLLGVAQVVGEDIVVLPHTLSQGKFYCFIPHELELVQTVQVAENLLGVARLVGEISWLCRTPCAPQMLFNVYRRLSDPCQFELLDPDPENTDPDLICTRVLVLNLKK